MSTEKPTTGARFKHEWSPMAQGYVLEHLRGVSRRVTHQGLNYNASLRIVERLRFSQPTLVKADAHRHLLAPPGEVLDLEPLPTTPWAYAVSLAVSRECRRLALVSGDEPRVHLVGGIATSSSLLGLRAPYKGSLFASRETNGIWALEDSSDSDWLWKARGKPWLNEARDRTRIPPHVVSSLFRAAASTLVFVTFGGQVSRTNYRGVFTHIWLDHTTGSMDIGICQSEAELSVFLETGECTFVLDDSPDTKASHDGMERREVLPARDLHDLVASRDLPVSLGAGRGPRGRTWWTLKPGTGLAPAVDVPAPEATRELDTETVSHTASNRVADRPNGYQVYATDGDPASNDTALIWLTPADKSLLNTKHIAGFLQATASQATSPERLHGHRNTIVRVLFPTDAVLADGPQGMLEDLRTVVEPYAKDGTSPLHSFHGLGLGGESFGASIALNLLLRHPQAFDFALLRSGNYDRNLQADGFEGLSLPRDSYHALYRQLSLPADDRALSRLPPIHITCGEDDEVQATNPLQSRGLAERVYAAGGRVGLLELPGEGHTFRGVNSCQALRNHEASWITAHGPHTLRRKDKRNART